MWERSMIDTARGRFELFKSGSGKPLCVTHLYSAFNEKGNTFANPFTTSYQVFLVNLRGCGHSVQASHSSQFSMEESIKDLEAIREALGYERWGFAGHSTGGMLALKYVINKPTSLTKIIAGGAAASKAYIHDEDCIYSQKNPNFERVMWIMDKLSNSSTPLETRKALGYEWDSMSFYSEESLQKALKTPNSGKTVGDRLDYFIKEEIPTYDVRTKLSEANLPSFIYAGKYDVQCPYQYGKEIADLIPNAQFMTFEKSNHNPFVEEEEKFKDFVDLTIQQPAGN